MCAAEICRAASKMRRMQTAGLTSDKYTARTSGLARLGGAQEQELGKRYRTQREYDEKQEAGNAGSHLCGTGLVPFGSSSGQSEGKLVRNKSSFEETAALPTLAAAGSPTAFPFCGSRGLGLGCERSGACMM